jgi:hypothetical protein
MYCSICIGKDVRCSKQQHRTSNENNERQGAHGLSRSFRPPLFVGFPEGYKVTSRASLLWGIQLGCRQGTFDVAQFNLGVLPARMIRGLAAPRTVPLLRRRVPADVGMLRFGAVFRSQFSDNDTCIRAGEL